MKILFLALGFGLTLVNFAFADETKAPSLLQAVRAEVSATCKDKASAKEKISCIKEVIEKLRAAKAAREDAGNDQK